MPRQTHRRKINWALGRGTHLTRNEKYRDPTKIKNIRGTKRPLLSIIQRLNWVFYLHFILNMAYKLKLYIKFKCILNFF